MRAATAISPGVDASWLRRCCGGNWTESGIVPAPPLDPGITSIIERDLGILQGLTKAATRRWPWVSEYQIPEMVQEFAQSMIAELDYQHEGRNTDKIAQLLRRDPGIHIPRIDWERSSAKVLTMEYMDGMMLNHYMERFPNGPERKSIAERLVHAMLHLIFIDGFFHADPHPGNIMVLDQNRISFSIVLLAFSVIMVGLIVGSSLSRRPTLLWDIPAIEIGFLIAALMFICLLLSIFRSGRF